MFNIDGLVYSYNEEKRVLDGVSFRIEKGKIYCLLGVNGAGKTTLFKCISGLLPSNMNKDILKEKILYIHDQMHFYYYLTGDEFVKLMISLKNKNIDKAIYINLLEQLKMKEHIENRISTYSLGTKQKLVMIVAFLLKYEYILMDEPFGSLDFIAAEVIMNTMKEYVKRDCAIVVSTHLIDIAQEVADIILFLNEGKIYTIENNFKSSQEIKAKIKELLKKEVL